MSYELCNHCLKSFEASDEIIACQKSHLPVHKYCEHHSTGDVSLATEVVFSEGDNGQVVDEDASPTKETWFLQI